MQRPFFLYWLINQPLKKKDSKQAETIYQAHKYFFSPANQKLSFNYANKLDPLSNNFYNLFNLLEISFEKMLILHTFLPFFYACFIYFLRMEEVKW